MTRVPSLTSKGVLEFLQKSPAIKFLDVYYLRTTPEEHKSLVETAHSKKVTLVLREPRKTWEVEREECDDEEEEEAQVECDDLTHGRDDDDNDNDDSDDEDVEKSSDEDEKILLEGLLNEIWSDQEADEE